MERGNEARERVRGANSFSEGMSESRIPPSGIV